MISKFNDQFEAVERLLTESSTAPYVQLEYFGYFLHRFLHRWVDSPLYDRNTFNAFTFNEERKKSLATAADKMAAMIERTDPMGGAEELAAVVHAVMLVAAGEDKPVGRVAMVRGIAEAVNHDLRFQAGSPGKEAIFASRRFLVAAGVLSVVAQSIT